MSMEGQQLWGRRVFDTLTLSPQDRLEVYLHGLRDLINGITSFIEVSSCPHFLSTSLSFLDPEIETLASETGKFLRSEITDSNSLKADSFSSLLQVEAYLNRVHQVINSGKQGGDLVALIGPVLQKSRMLLALALGREVEQKEILDLNQWLEHYFLNLKKTDLAIEYTLNLTSESHSRVYISPLELTLALDNLHSNALRSLSSKKTPGRISFTLDFQGDNDKAEKWAHLSILDSGSGMDRATLNALNPYFSTQSGPRHGLGLIQVIQMAVNMGGSFLVESKEGVGSKMTLRLPCQVHS